jgi:proteasome accessory factor A
MAELSTYLKCGTTNLVIKAIEAGLLDSPVEIEEPVGAMRLISRDLSCRKVFSTDKGRLSATDIQELYLSAARSLVERAGNSAADLDLISRWEEVISALKDDPMQLGDRLDWVIKFQLLDSLQRKKGWKDGSWELRGADMQYHRIDGKRGLYYFLRDEGRIDRVTSDDLIAKAVVGPPEDTRAYFRGNVIRRFPSKIAYINWESIGFTGGDAIHFNPTSLTKKKTGSVFDRTDSIEEILEAVRKS